MYRAFKWVALSVVTVLVIAVGYVTYQVLTFDSEAWPANHGKVHAALFAGDGAKQPLLVGLGGAEGGNAWVRRHLKPARDRFLQQGYAVLALAYFGEDGLPREVDRISVDAVHDAIVEAARDPRINPDCIAVIGGSKGAELALLLASHYTDIKAVVGVVPGDAVYPAHTNAMSTPSFSLDGAPLPWVPMTWGAVPALLRRDLRSAFDTMREDREAVEKAAIAVERINGPILLLSATRDEFWPSQDMSESIVARLRRNNFPFPVEHVAVEGDHASPQRRFETVERFLTAHLLSEREAGCPR